MKDKDQNEGEEELLPPPPARPLAAGNHRGSTPAIPPSHRALYTQRRASGLLVLRWTARGPRNTGDSRRCEARPVVGGSSRAGGAPWWHGGDRRRRPQAARRDDTRWSAMAARRGPQPTPWRRGGDPRQRHGGATATLGGTAATPGSAPWQRDDSNSMATTCQPDCSFTMCKDPLF